MTGSRPRLPRSVQRRRRNKPALPVALMGTLFVIYVLIGLLLSVPAPPIWIWVPAVVGTVLLSLGLNRPAVVPDRKSEWMLGLFTYVGALFLVMALAIAANYIGGGQSFDNIRFLVGLVALALLTLLAIVLTAAAAIVNAQTGEQLRQTMDYNRSLTTVIGTCLAGTCIGGLAGFLTLAIAARS